MFGRLQRRQLQQGRTISAAASAFVLAKRATGRTPSTIEWYQARFDRAAAFLGDDAALDTVTTDQLRRFLIALKAGTAVHGVNADSYVEGHRKALDALFDFAVAERLVKRSPMASIDHWKGERRLPVVLSSGEVDALLSAQPRTSIGVRNQALLLLMFDTGIRVGELAAARVGDLDFERGELKVRGKSRRERVVPISVPVRSVLLSYLNRSRPLELFAGSDALFLGRHGRPITTNAVRLLQRRARERAEITTRVHPHAFRSSFATHYVLNGGDPATAQAIMGIRSAQVFNGYVNVALADMKAAHAKASPVERMLRGA
jgi:site-specific recombinase XerD